MASFPLIDWIVVGLIFIAGLAGMCGLACAFFAAGETWHPRAAALGLKDWTTASWRSWSHFFSTERHECPAPSRWRDIFLDPALRRPPFLAIVTLTAKKNLIFRGRIAHSADLFAVQVEDESVFAACPALSGAIRQCEELLALGFTRKEIASGRYSQGRLGKVPRELWRTLADRVARVRADAPALLRLALHVALQPEKAE